MSDRKCSKCEKFDEKRFNYCCNCGYHFTKNKPERMKRAYAPSVYDKYCGNCGEELNKCKC